MFSISDLKEIFSTPKAWQVIDYTPVFRMLGFEIVVNRQIGMSGKDRLVLFAEQRSGEDFVGFLMTYNRTGRSWETLVKNVNNFIIEWMSILEAPKKLWALSSCTTKVMRENPKDVSLFLDDALIYILSRIG